MVDQRCGHAEISDWLFFTGVYSPGCPGDCLWVPLPLFPLCSGISTENSPGFLPQKKEDKQNLSNLPPNRKLLWSPNLSAASKVEEHFGVSGT
jgi:hypothetical protein